MKKHLVFLLCALLCAGLLTALVYTGLETTLRAAPLLSLPAAAAGALCLGRRESP